MSTLGWIILAVAVFAVILFVAKSNSRLASSIRAMFTYQGDQAGRAIDSVEARTGAAKVNQEAQVGKGRKTVYQIMQELEALKIDRDAKAKEVFTDLAAMEGAKKAGDKETFQVLYTEWLSDSTALAGLNASIDDVASEMKTMQNLTDEARLKLAEIENEGAVLRSKARVADVSTIFAEGAAGLSPNASEADMEAARNMVNEKTAKAQAAVTAATEGLTPGEAAAKRAEQYKKAVSATPGVPSVDEMWNSGTPKTK